uniref:Uncharacterized protein n=1 Tax=Rhizophora mucronata TaxID=61149 RepID=A0A2P2PD06_RHIMU
MPRFSYDLVEKFWAELAGFEYVSFKSLGSNLVWIPALKNGSNNVQALISNLHSQGM